MVMGAKTIQVKSSKLLSHGLLEARLEAEGEVLWSQRHQGYRVEICLALLGLLVCLWVIFSRTSRHNVNR